MPESRLVTTNVRKFGPCAARLKALLDGYRAPEMMAMGGSVFNGVSSMHINWWLADWSAPAQVARALHGGDLVQPGHSQSTPHFGRRSLQAASRPRQRPSGSVSISRPANLFSLDAAVRIQGWTMDPELQVLPTPTPRHGRSTTTWPSPAPRWRTCFIGTPADYRARMNAVRRVDNLRSSRDHDKFWSARPPAQNLFGDPRARQGSKDGRPGGCRPRPTGAVQDDLLLAQLQPSCSIPPGTPVSTS